MQRSTEKLKEMLFGAELMGGTFTDPIFASFKAASVDRMLAARLSCSVISRRGF